MQRQAGAAADKALWVVARLRLSTECGALVAGTPPLLRTTVSLLRLSAAPCIVSTKPCSSEQSAVLQRRRCCDGVLRAEHAVCARVVQLRTRFY